MAAGKHPSRSAALLPDSNGYPAAEINGGPAPGYSSGRAQDAIADVLESRLPAGMTWEWTELAYQELVAGNTMLCPSTMLRAPRAIVEGWIFPLCVLLMYVVLAAQYESWSLPLSVILIVPMALFAAIAGVWIAGGDNNVFTQIAFLVVAGLACKNAILIVEFARQREAEGDSALDAPECAGGRHRADPLSRGRGRLPGPARRGAYAARGRGCRGAGRGGGVDGRYRALQSARRPSADGGRLVRRPDPEDAGRREVSRRMRDRRRRERGGRH